MSGLRRAERVVMPYWLAVPLTVLGIVFLLFALPLGVAWGDYAALLVMAVVTGASTALRYEVTVLERSEEGVVARIRKRPPVGRMRWPQHGMGKRARIALWTVGWCFVFFVLLLAPPEGPAEVAASIYLLASVVGLPLYAKQRRRRRSEAAARIREVQDVRNWT